jgi:hypothetical protein
MTKFDFISVLVSIAFGLGLTDLVWRYLGE